MGCKISGSEVRFKISGSGVGCKISGSEMMFKISGIGVGCKISGSEVRFKNLWKWGGMQNLWKRDVKSLEVGCKSLEVGM